MKTAAAEAPALTQPINILIVDDEPKNLTVLETVLDDPGYRLIRAESADEALLALVEGEFALIILDIRMPGMTGFELAQMIKERKRTARIPIIFLTAYYNEDQHVLEGYGTGAVDYLHKPINPVVLRSKVAVFAELHRRERECGTANVALQAEVAERRRVEGQLRDLNENLEQRVRERAEALRRSEDRYRAIGESIDYGVWTCDAAGRNTYASESFLRLVGLTQQQCSDSGWGDTLHPDEAAATVAAWRECVRTGAKWEREHRFRGVDGQWHSVLARGLPVKDEHGRIIAWSGINLDITDRKRMETQLREAKEAAETANASKDRFLAVLSHELRTPLTPVLLTIGLLEQDASLRPDLRDALAMIKESIELETKLIDDLLDVSRIVSGKVTLRPELVDLNDAVRQAHVVCQPQSREQGVTVELALCAESLMVRADSARLQQVLWNVMKNAIKFSTTGGAVCVSTARPAPGRVEVRVRDQGIGIAPAVLPKIFDAFEQGDPAITRQFGGLGLGLAISKALVELHGGIIRAESDGPGRGATFIVELREERGAAATPPAPAAPAGKSGFLRLLVVEDHVHTARTLCHALRNSGYKVAVAHTVRGALDLAGRETFDLLVTDLGLPDGTGLELLASVTKIQPLAGIVMSGYGMDEDLRRSREAGFVAHIVKPFDVSQLVAAITRATKSPGR